LPQNVWALMQGAYGDMQDGAPEQQLVPGHMLFVVSRVRQPVLVGSSK
jgi:hypothetical protein